MQNMRIAYSAELLNMDGMGAVQSASPLGTLCEMIYCFGLGLQMKPQVFSPHNTNELWISFPQASIECGDFFEDFGECMASLYDSFPVRICGFTEFPEEGELSVSLCRQSPGIEAANGSEGAAWAGGAAAKADGEKGGARGKAWNAAGETKEAREKRAGKEKGSFKIECIKKNVSGQNFNILSAVWIAVQFQRKAETDFVKQVVEGMDFDSQASAVCPRWEDVFSEKGLFEDTGMSFYRYIFFGGTADPGTSMISCLTVRQIEELWLRFLTDGQDALEFELFYERLEELGETQRRNLMMALRLALLEMNIRIEHSCGEFRVYDEEGGRLWFDFASGSAAEKLFLKLLFPVAAGASEPERPEPCSICC